MTPYDTRLPRGVEGGMAGEVAAWLSPAHPRASVLLGWEGSFAICLDLTQGGPCDVTEAANQQYS